MRLLVYIVFALIITGCACSGSKTAKQLDEAQLLLKTNPRSAFDKLCTYDVSQFSDSATMARWALLYSKAMLANNLYAPSDTIINIAIDFYSNKNLTDNLAEAERIKDGLYSPSSRQDALATALYIQKEKEFMLYKERITRMKFIYGAVAVLAIALCVIAWQRQRIRLTSLQHESLMAEATALKEEIGIRKTEFYTMESKLAALLASKFNIIDELCETYYESQGTKIERKAIVEKVQSHINDLKTDHGLFAEMERNINECHAGMADRLRKNCPWIKNDDYRLYIFLACRLSNRSIALLLGENIDVVYKRKSRLKAKINSADIPDKEGFISIFKS